MALKKWVDTSSNGFNLRMFQEFENNIMIKQGLLIEPKDTFTEEAKNKLVSIGFKINEHGIIYSYDSVTEMVPLLNRNFSNLKRIDIDTSELVKRIDITNSNEEDIFDSIELEDQNKPLIGYLGENSLGHKVYANENGVRYIQPNIGEPLYENETAMSSAAFLRGDTLRSLITISDAFVKSLKNGTRYNADDFLSFSKSVFNDAQLTLKDKRVQQFYALIETAITKSVINDTKNSGNLLTEMYKKTQEIQENILFLGDIYNDFIPSPIATSIHRMIGMEDFKDKKVVLSGVESSSLFSYMPNNTNITAFTQEKFLDGLNEYNVTNRRKITLNKENISFKDADVSIINSIPKLSEKEFIFGDFKTHREDFSDIIKSLSERNDNGKSAVILKHKTTQNDEMEIKNFLTYLSQNYYVDGALDILGGLFGGHINSENMTLISIGPKRKNIEPTANTNISTVDTYDQVWTWALNMTIERAKTQENIESLEGIISDDEMLNDDNDNDVNMFQAPYVPLSRIGKPTKMVPRNLDESTRYALQKLGKKYDDIDAWVGKELRMSQEELAKAFSPEQIDVLALFMDAEDSGKKGSAIIDQMGVGKGRVISALLWRAHLKGKKPMFMTERPLNISDIVRDLKHIGVFEKLNILIINNDVQAIDETDNSVLVQSPDSETLDKIFKSEKFPDQYDLVIGTYSMFNRNGDEPKVLQRSKQDAEGNYIKKGNGYEQENYVEEDTRTPHTLWIRRAINEDVYLALDESHVAAGETGNIAKNIGTAKDNSGFTLYSSATWSANSKNISLYDRLIPDSIDINDLQEALKKGGETFQETLSSMLVKDGVMRRCEPNSEDVDFRVIIDDKNAEYYENSMDSLSPILSSMAILAGDMDTQASMLNKEMLAAGLLNDENTIEEENNEVKDDNGKPVKKRIKSMQITRMGFGSPLHNISRLFLMSLMAPVYAEYAVNALKNGQKPVLQVENTVQTILDEIYKEEKDNNNERIPEFKDVMKRYLKQLTHSKKWDNKLKERVSFNMAEPDPEIEAIWQISDELIKILPEYILQADKDEKYKDVNTKKEVESYIDTIAHTLDASDDVIKKAIKRFKTIFETFPENGSSLAPFLRNIHLKLPFNFYRRVLEIENMIENMPFIQLSAIDVIRDRIEKAGYSCGEITGRNREVRDGQVVRRKVLNAVDVKNSFNRGEYDAVIINAKGSTGIDLHSSERFKDQRQRVYMPIQFIADPKKQKQAEGRTARTGQVNTPMILLLVAGLASEMRLLAMYNTKSRRISANTTSNRDHAMLINEIPDIMNAIGDKIVPEYFEARPDLMKRLCLKSENILSNSDDNRTMAKMFENSVTKPVTPVPEPEQGGRRRRKKKEEETVEAKTIDEDSQDNRRKASEFFARLILLPSALAKKIINEITIEYEAVKKELEDRGDTPLKPKMIDGKVYLRDKNIVDGIENEALITEFDRPVYAQNIVIKRMIEPLRSEQVINYIDRGIALEASENPDEIADTIARHKEEMLKPLLPNDAVDVEDALQRYPDSGLAKQNAKLDAIITCLKKLRAGKEIKFQLEAGEAVSGLIQRIVIPDEKHRHIPQAYKAEVLVPGQAKSLTLSISSLIYDELFEINDGYHGEDAVALIRQFDEAGEASKLEARTILVGNEWLALNLAIKNRLGSMTMFEDENGIRRRGILVLKKHSKLRNVPSTIPSVDMCHDFMNDPNVSPKNKRIYLNNQNIDAISVAMVNNETVEFRLPGTTSSLFPKLMTTELFKTIVDNAEQKPKSVFKFNAPVKDIGQYIKILMNFGIRPQVGSTARDWVNTWRNKNYNTLSKNNEQTLQQTNSI